MAVELQVLLGAVLLAAVQLLLYAVPANREIDSAWLAGPRDTPMPGGLSARTGRLQRAFQNHIEGLAMFAPAALAAAAAGVSTPVTQGAAVAYLAARIVYVPLYWAGTPWARSLVWAVGFFATVALALAALIQA